MNQLTNNLHSTVGKNMKNPSDMPLTILTKQEHYFMQDCLFIQHLSPKNQIFPLLPDAPGNCTP